MNTDAVAVVTAVAQRPGTEPPCADGMDVQRTGDRVCAAVVDAAGHRPEAIRYVHYAPAVITHVGATLGGLVGLITAGQMAQAYDCTPHVSAVFAVVEPGYLPSLHWIGDCRAYGWDGEALTLWTTDQTMGEWLRCNGGVPVEIAEQHDNWARLGLEQASAATCRQVEVEEGVRLVLLMTDGVSDQVDHEVMETLCRRHGGNPQALADALVAAAEEDEDGYRDDATVVVILMR